MNHLFRENLRQLRGHPTVEVPQDAIFKLPEKILQFGTGAFLRGLADYFVDKANREGIFNGRIVVVKSTDEGDLKAFDRQDNLYTICSRGIKEGRMVEENIISSSISRVLSARTQWSLVLDLARNPAISIVISNTTELGIQLVPDDIYQWPPVSFPGKLLAFLYARFVAFSGSPDHGVVVVPTELIAENGTKLESIVLELAHRNGLESNFIDWLEQHNSFCNSLVDRIVPGRPDDVTKKEMEEELGFQDELMITAEHYHLWAIEGDERVKNILSFAEASEGGIVIQPDIELYRELKLRLLNGAHTLGGGLAHLCGFTTVVEAMDDPFFSGFLSNLLGNEIAPAIPYPLEQEVARNFGRMVLDRFRNPYIQHKWLNINFNFSAKMLSRVMPTFLNYEKLFGQNPDFMTFGFAAYIYYMKPARKGGDNYYGFANGKYYLIQDARASYFHQKWQIPSLPDMVHAIMKDPFIWGEDLTQVGTTGESVVVYLESIKEHGALEALKIFRHKTEYSLVNQIETPTQY
ncbi:tagaturonate reductase [Dyadobacter sp. CY312]|uniref:tagaturonate reductase n=1 Tax=Dyadobacter sp. CY312 TaxID=2907303 RepID=UPI001F2D4EDB|nr:tagaturonate reductase [Dyadobacter sp. CY312]MCE7044138.1 tagaturonate reductase [Dyadobacter sp. CY312]